VEQIKSLPGLEDEGRLYSSEVSVNLSGNAVNNIKNFFEKDDRLGGMAHDTAWTDGYNKTVSSGVTDSVVFGCDGLTWDLLGSARYLMQGTFDPELFSEGRHVMAVGPGTDDFSQTMPTFSVGEEIEINGAAYTVMGIVAPISPITSGGSSFRYSSDFIMPADEFRRQWPENTLRKFYFNVSDEQAEAAQKILTDYQQRVDPSMPIKSRNSMAEQYEAETRSSAVMGNTISIVIALVGVLNFINSMVTAIISRRREFAMLQSVGMSKRQLRGLLIFEGIDYAALTLVLSYVLGAVTVGTVVRFMADVGHTTTFQFTLMPLIVCTPLLLALAVAIPFACFKNLEKQSLVERLRNTD
jgi:putative ABC transport system permease protein